MKLKPGDKVKMMDDTETYRVTEISADGKVLLSGDDGLEFKVEGKLLIPALMTPESLFNQNRKQKKEDNKKSSTPIIKKSAGSTRVVDLHIGNPSFGAGLPVALDLQIIRFRGELDAAIKAGLKEITFIHGVGTGVLKDELRRILIKDYPSIEYHDASFRKYGYGGATRVIISKGAR